jgi:hypothetical protein
MITNHQIVHGNLIPEGLVAPGSASWPSGAEDQQLHYKVDEQKFYIYNLATDTWLPIAAPSESEMEPVYQDFVPLQGKTFAAVRALFFSQFMYNRTIGDWSSLYRYCWWQFSTLAMAGSYTDPQRFATSNAFFSYMEALEPTTLPNIYDRGLYIRTYEEVDLADPFPVLLRHRNSITAAIKGNRNWNRSNNPTAQQWGINIKFNFAYYLNFVNELPMRFVSTNPGTVLPWPPYLPQHDNVVWHPRGTHSKWRWPKVGSTVTISNPSARMVWDAVASNFVPAPVTSYSILDPFFLEEPYRGRLLAIEAPSPPPPPPPPPVGPIDAEHRRHELTWPLSLVFPVVAYDGPTPRWYAYLIYPHGADTWITEAFPTGTYELILCCKYKHTFRKQYFAYSGPGKPYSGSDVNFLWHTDPILFARMGGLTPGVDEDAVPFQIDMARRNKLTGKRSKWYPLFTITRRIAHAAFRVDPASWKR